MPDCYLLINPAMAADGFRGDDGCDPMLDEESRADPICIGGASCGGLVSAQQRTKHKGAWPAPLKYANRISVEFEEVRVADATHPPVDVLGDRPPTPSG